MVRDNLLKAKAGANEGKPVNFDSDPFNIGARFLEKHKQYFPKALREIKAGKKTSCWMWYIIPTPPRIVDGVEKSSGTSMLYALRDLPPQNQQGFNAARAYLTFPETHGINLRKNYVDIITAIGDQLEAGVKPVVLMGYQDDPKLRSSCRLFELVCRNDAEVRDVHQACARVLHLLKEPAMQANAPGAGPQGGTFADEKHNTEPNRDAPEEATAERQPAEKDREPEAGLMLDSDDRDGGARNASATAPTKTQMKLTDYGFGTAFTSP